MSLVNVFYSYSHKDQSHREGLEKHLKMLVRNKCIEQWYDSNIIPGSKYQKDIDKKLESADVVIFLVTANWLGSDACVDEWNRSKEFAKFQPNKRLVPIIASKCAWKDFDDMADMLALPEDGREVSSWSSKDSAWSNVYEGIKSVVEEVKKNFKLVPDFEEELKNIEFCSANQKEIFLDDVFVFPNLKIYPESKNGVELAVDNMKDLLLSPRQFIVGENQSGKTKLSSKIYLYQFEKRFPCVYVDISSSGGFKDKRKIIENSFKSQQVGDFDVWFSSEVKLVVFDNLTKDKKSVDLIAYAEEHFSHIIILSNSDIYRSYYNDDDRFVSYRDVYIKPFCHSKQEKLIHKWLAIKTSEDDVDHSLVDSIENNINSIIIDNKVLPRYPFFILSILQTYESFMPENLKITAYGHCYHALIVARLIKSGINQEDSALDSAFTFCSSLAYRIHLSGNGLFVTDIEFDDFVADYSSDYIIKKSLLNRLFSEKGFLERANKKITFSMSYSYYFFLGKYLTDNYADNKERVSSMVESSFARHNSLTLIFTIHHANDISIIDEILTHTMCAIDDRTPAVLSKEQTSIFNSLLVNVLPEKLGSNNRVQEEREKERNYRTQHESSIGTNDEEIEALASTNEHLNQVFQCNKNIEILSQILKNKTGSLKKSKLTEIVEIICDAGLRLASVMLDDHREIEACAKFVYEQYKESESYDSSKTDSYHIGQIRRSMNLKVMLWVLSALEKSVSAINKPELKDIVVDVVSRKNTPAFHLIKYFYMLDTSVRFDSDLKRELEYMTKNYTSDKSAFLNRIISIRTQHYVKTHKVKESYRQSIFSLLDLKHQKFNMVLEKQGL